MSVYVLCVYVLRATIDRLACSLFLAGISTRITIVQCLYYTKITAAFVVVSMCGLSPGNDVKACSQGAWGQYRPVPQNHNYMAKPGSTWRANTHHTHTQARCFLYSAYNSASCFNKEKEAQSTIDSKLLSAVSWFDAKTYPWAYIRHTLSVSIFLITTSMTILRVYHCGNTVQRFISLYIYSSYKMLEKMSNTRSMLITKLT